MRKLSPVLFFALALGVLMVGCKTPEATASKYKYLLKDKSGNTIASSTTTTKVEEHGSEVMRGGDDSRSPESGVSVSSDLNKVIGEAKTYLGVPYRYGGINRNGIDCSGLTTNAYQAIGVKLPRSSKDQSEFGKKIHRSDLHPGDLVFFTAKGNGKIDHVGMVTKVLGHEVTFIHATTKKGVRFDRLDTGYWVDKYMVARRPDQS